MTSLLTHGSSRDSPPWARHSIWGCIRSGKDIFARIGTIPGASNASSDKIDGCAERSRGGGGGGKSSTGSLDPTSSASLLPIYALCNVGRVLAIPASMISVMYCSSASAAMYSQICNSSPDQARKMGAHNDADAASCKLIQRLKVSWP